MQETTTIQQQTSVEATIAMLRDSVDREATADQYEREVRYFLAFFNYGKYQALPAFMAAGNA